MKNPISILFVLIFAGSISSCNAFDWLDPNINSLDRCQSLNDAGDYEGAIAACKDADPDGVNVDAQIELADASLAVLGINIQSLSEIFLNKDGGTITMVDLAESILAKGKINRENYSQSKEYAENAVIAMDRYGALLGHTLEEKQVSVFYSLLARVCQISVLMAYADIDSPTPDGLVTRADICTPSEAECAVDSPTICTGTKCNGMNRTDAGTAADGMVGLVTLLNTPASEGGLPSNLDTGAISEMVGILVKDPSTGTLTPIQDFIVSTYKPDAGRRILLEMARAN